MRVVDCQLKKLVHGPYAVTALGYDDRGVATEWYLQVPADTPAGRMFDEALAAAQVLVQARLDEGPYPSSQRYDLSGPPRVMRP